MLAPARRMTPSSAKLVLPERRRHSMISSRRSKVAGGRLPRLYSPQHGNLKLSPQIKAGKPRDRSPTFLADLPSHLAGPGLPSLELIRAYLKSRVWLNGRAE